MKRTPLRKQAKPKTNSWHRKKCVEQAKVEVRERDDGKCQRCGRTTGVMNCSHIYPEGQYHSLSAEPINMKLLCFQCHMWWHENPLEAGKWIRQKFPDRLKILDKMARQNNKVDWKEKYSKVN